MGQAEIKCGFCLSHFIGSKDRLVFHLENHAQERLCIANYKCNEFQFDFALATPNQFLQLAVLRPMDQHPKILELTVSLLRTWAAHLCSTVKLLGQDSELDSLLALSFNGFHPLLKFQITKRKGVHNMYHSNSFANLLFALAMRHSSIVNPICRSIPWYFVV